MEDVSFNYDNPIKLIEAWKQQIHRLMELKIASVQKSGSSTAPATTTASATSSSASTPTSATSSTSSKGRKRMSIATPVAPTYTTSENAFIHPQITAREYLQSAAAVLRQKKLNTLNQKQDMDKAYLQLQNLEYEIMYLKKEIKKCESTETIYQNIPLNSEVEILATFPHYTEVRENDPHTFMLHRLDYELQERQRMKQRCESLNNQKEILKKQLKTATEDIDKIKHKLSDYVQASKSLQSYLKLDLTYDRAQAQLSHLLPKKFYSFYTNATKYMAKYPDVKVSINGNLKDSQAFQQMLDQEMKQGFFKEQTSLERPTSSPSNINDDTVEADGDDVDLTSGQNRHGARSTLDRDATKWYQKYPCQISIVIPDSRDNGSQNTTAPINTTLSFAYLPRLDVICVHSSVNVKDPVNQYEYMLQNLFHKEDEIMTSKHQGESPKDVNEFITTVLGDTWEPDQATEAEGSSSTTAKAARYFPYRWIGKLSKRGSDNPNSDLEIFWDEFLAAVRERWLAWKHIEIELRDIPRQIRLPWKLRAEAAYKIVLLGWEEIKHHEMVDKARVWRAQLQMKNSFIYMDLTVPFSYSSTLTSIKLSRSSPNILGQSTKIPLGQTLSSTSKSSTVSDTPKKESVTTTNEDDQGDKEALEPPDVEMEEFSEDKDANKGDMEVNDSDAKDQAQSSAEKKESEEDELILSWQDQVNAVNKGRETLHAQLKCLLDLMTINFHKNV